MAKAFQEISLSEPSPDNAFHVMPLAGDGQHIIRTLPASDRLYYTHVVNTYENASGIVIDLSTAPTNPFQRNLSVAFMMDKAARDADKGARMVVRRFLLPFDGGKIAPVASSELLSDPLMSTDFLRINPRFVGKKHCFFWSVKWFTDHSSMASMAVTKHELCGQRTGMASLSWSRKNWYPSEPVLLPSPQAGAAEDAGMLVFTALDGAKRQTSLVVLDAATMEVLSEAGPFPPIGFTTHGEFYAADALSASDEAVGGTELPASIAAAV
jgi:carotenoid cleavage dioxygenase-like enzyme